MRHAIQTRQHASIIDRGLSSSIATPEPLIQTIVSQAYSRVVEGFMSWFGVQSGCKKTYPNISDIHSALLTQRVSLVNPWKNSMNESTNSIV